ncbi:MAG: alpha-galactosidase [Vagococcus sp.]|jgi:alpha-galactosidase|nr:alpha-galactosidase [Vagococcus sp.]
MLLPHVYINDVLESTKIEEYGKQDYVTQHIVIKKELDQKLRLVYFVPLLDLQFMWHPTSDGVVFLKNEWDEGATIRLNKSQPVFALINQNNQSLFSLAINELINEMELTVGVHEESASVKVTIEMIIPSENYKLALSVITGRRKWSEVVQEQVNWLYRESGAQLPKIPATSFEPVLSTWYSFHQHVTDKGILQESEYYKALGARTLILDDGWQTNDSSRRYAYAGDWQVSSEKFPNFTQHVREVQSLEMNYLVWLSLPYVGKKSENWNLFKDDFLYMDEFQHAGVLDIRKKKVRSYLIKTITSFINKYSIDGLKIDFLETFFLDKTINFEISKGLLLLLEELKKSLIDKPNFLIEFRQDYINPLMMQYCQIVRSKDCPNNYILNRIRTVDLRLSCPFTAVHSDMIMWNKDEKIEDAALHIINTMFSVPQLSMKYDELSKDEIQMITFWLDFIKEHQELLLNSNFEPSYPQEGYSVVQVGQLGVTLTAIFGEKKVITRIENLCKKEIFVNGTKVDELYLSLPKGNYKIVIKNCIGVVTSIENKELLETQLMVIKVPRSGLLIIDTE